MEGRKSKFVIDRPILCGSQEPVVRRHRRGEERSRGPAERLHQAAVGHFLCVNIELGLLGLSLLLQFLRLNLLLLRVIVSEVVHHDGYGEGHDQDPAHCTH